MDWKNIFTRILRFIKGLKATTIVIAVLVGIVFLQKACGPSPETVTEYKDVIVYKDTTLIKYDTIRILDTKTIIKTDTIIHIDIDTIFPDIDTTAILSDYYASKFFTDTLSNDTVLLAVSRYKVSQNELERQSFTYRVNRPQQVNYNTTIINPPVNKVFLDLSIGGNMTNFGVPIGISFQDKKDRVYSAKYDPINKTYYIGTSFKLFQYGKSK